MHVHCPHCHGPIEILDEVKLEEIACPSCGSSFSLLFDEPTTRHHQQPQRIGHFELIDQLGTGAFGTVWKARDTELDRTVALKIPRKDQLDPEETELFLREARAAAQLTHPGIVSVHEVGREDETVYIISDYVEGVTLADRLTDSPFTAREAAELCLSAAEALHHAHEAGVIHRDLKPSNIMLDIKGKPHLMDFGLARREAGEITMTVEGRILGTPAYMSPEQARGEGHHADRRSDVYSLGVVLFEMLTGERPFRGNARMLIHHVIHDDPPGPRRLNGTIPRDLETICLKCLHKEPSRRYDTALSLAEDLRRFLEGRAIVARPVGRVERLAKWVRRNPVVSSLLAAVFLVLVAGVAVSSYFAVRATHNAAQARQAQGEAESAAFAEAQARKTAEVLADKEAAARKTADEERERAEGLLYASQLELAQTAWRENNAKAAWHHLESTRWDYRGWEHDYLHTLFTGNQHTFHGHTDRVFSVSFSPDGKRIVSGSGDKTLKVWNALTGEEVLTLQGHTGGVSSVRYSPDGKHILSGSGDTTLKVWNALTGQEVLTLQGHTGGVKSVSFSLDGKRIVSGGWDQMVKVWDAQSGQELLSFKAAGLMEKGAVWSAHFSPDGKRIVWGGHARTIKVCDSLTGEEIFGLRGHTSFVYAVSFSPDGKRIVSGSWDGTVKVWDASSGQELLTLQGHTGRVASLAFSPDGKRIVSGSWDRSIMVWDAFTGKKLHHLTGHTWNVECVSFSPDGKRIVSGSGDWTVKGYDVGGDQNPRTLRGHSSGVTSVCFSPDGKRIVSGSDDKTVKVWDVLSGQEVVTLQGHTEQVSSVSYSPDGKRIVSGSWNGQVKVWDAQSGQEVLILQGHIGPVFCVSFCSDGKRIVSAGVKFDRDNNLGSEIKLWDALSGNELLNIIKAYQQVTSLSCSPDGKRIVGGSNMGVSSLTLWDAVTGQEVQTLKGHTTGINSVSFSPDGKRIVSASNDTTVMVWDAVTGHRIHTLVSDASSPVTSVSFSPDGKRIVSASGGKALTVWDALSGQELLALKGQPGTIYSVSFSPDNKHIVSGGSQGTLTVWKAVSSEEGLSLIGTTSPQARVSFSPDGKYIFAKDTMGKIQFWDTRTGQPLPKPPTQLPAGKRLQQLSDGRFLAIRGYNIILSDPKRQKRAREIAREKLTRWARFDPDWHRAELLDAQQRGNAFAASLHSERLLRAYPFDASLHIQRVHALAQLGHAREASAHLMHALFLHPQVHLSPIDPGAAERGREARTPRMPRVEDE